MLRSAIGSSLWKRREDADLMLDYF